MKCPVNFFINGSRCKRDTLIKRATGDCYWAAFSVILLYVVREQALRLAPLCRFSSGHFLFVISNRRAFSQAILLYLKSLLTGLSKTDSLCRSFYASPNGWLDVLHIFWNLFLTITSCLPAMTSFIDKLFIHNKTVNQPFVFWLCINTRQYFLFVKIIRIFQ